jgi:hypothetical protein
VIKRLQCPACQKDYFELIYNPDSGAEEEFFLQCSNCYYEFPLGLAKVFLSRPDESLEGKPEKFYNVEMCRIGYGSRVIVVKARSEEEASEKALDEAGDHEYSEKSSEYEVQGVWKADSLGA